MRIGLFGGTFNPVHWGHMRTADEIRKIFDLTQVIFIPAHIPPHKKNAKVASAYHRLKMLELAVQHSPCFATSDVELKRPDTSYSVETISYFKHTFGKEVTFFFYCGYGCVFGN